MRYVRIFLLYFENVFQYRSKIFVYFLTGILDAFLYLLYWRGASGSMQSGTAGWVFSDLISYYLVLMAIGGVLIAHHEEDAYEDIQLGNISMYLVKPMSYLRIKFCDELPWRIIHGLFGIIVLIAIVGMYSLRLPIVMVPMHILLFALVAVAAYIISFLFKSILLISAIWITDISGLKNFVGLLILVLAGFVMPIPMFPAWTHRIVFTTPFPYMVYFPVVSLLGKISPTEGMRIVLVQSVWIIGLYQCYSFLWRRGLRRYSGIGQ